MKFCRNFPNPFHSRTDIEFSLPRTSKVGLQIYNEAGELVYRLFSHTQSSGRKRLTWDGRNSRGQKMPTGDYFYVINVDDAYEISNRMTKGV